MLVKRVSPGDVRKPGGSHLSVRAFFILGLLTMVSSSYAFEMAGGAYKVTRDDVNAGGLFQAAGSFIMNGSVNGVESASISGTTGIKSGLEAVQDYPGTVVDVSLVSSTNTLSSESAELKLSWTAPAAEMIMNKPSTLYIIKYASAPISTQSIFTATAAYNQSIVPATPGTQENLTLTGLIANTSYYLGIEAQDSDQNQAYLSVGASTVPTVTLSPIPGFVFVLTSSQTYIQIQWLADNPYPGTPVKYEAQVSDVSDFSSVTGFNIFNSTVQFSTGTTFSGLTSGTSYYMRVRSFNRVNVPSNWAYSSSTSTSLGTPGMPFFSNIQIDRLTATWAPLSGAIYSIEEWPDGNFTGTPIDFKNTGTTPSATFVGLTHNTTYWYRVQGSVNGQATAYGFPNFTMTAVNSVTPTGYSVYQTSASFTWTDSLNSVNLPINYRVEISTRVNFTPVYTSSTVQSSSTYPHATPYSSTSTVLTPNTSYYYRVMALNGIGNPTTSYFVNGVGGPYATNPVAPDGILFQSVSLTQFQVSWFENVTSPDNPVGTSYEVKVTTGPDYNAPAVDYVITRSTDPQNYLFSQNISANTTYFVHIRAKGRSILNNVDSNWLSISTVTRPASVTNPTFAVDLTSATVFWDTSNGPTTVYSVDLKRNGSQLANSTTSLAYTTFAEAFNVALATNTTYDFLIHTLPNGSWPAPSVVTVTTSTLADIPAFVGPSFMSVSTDSITVQWGFNTNPADTTFRVKYSTDNFATSSFFSDVVGATNLQVNGLLTNSTYWFKVSAVNRIGRETADLDLGNIVTLANAPSFVGFTVGVSSITVSWNANGNLPGTIYETTSSLTSTGALLHSAGNMTGGSWTDVGLSTNTSYTYSIRAINQGGVPTAWAVLGTTWTYAAQPPTPSAPTQLSPFAFNFTFSAGSNPTVVPHQTQFAIKIIADTTPVGSGRNLTGYFISPNAMSGNMHSTSTYQNLTDPVWGRFDVEWNNGIIVSTGMNGGATYALVVYARNGDNGSAPAIPTAPSAPQVAFTQSGEPHLIMGAYTAEYSNNNQVWINTTIASVTAYGAFHFHYELSPQVNSITSGYPGWNGQIITSTPTSAQNSNPDYTGALSGFAATGEGQYYINVRGDDFPYSDQAPPAGTFPQGLHLEQSAGLPFRFYVDMTKPSVQDITAQFTSTVPIPIFSSVATPCKTPYFQWTTLNPAGAYQASPIIGFNYSLSSDLTVNPSTGTPDPSISFSAISASAYTAAVAISTPQVYGVTYYFKAAALDAAGNWSDPVTFVYMPRPDTEFPRIINVNYGGVVVPSSGAGVAVSTTPTIDVTFSKRMHGPSMTTDGFYLKGTYDQGCNLISQTIPLTIVYSTATRTAEMVPQAVLRDGYMYELLSSTTVIDEAGNPLNEPLLKKFWTLMNPTVDNCNVDDDGTKLLFPANVWGSWAAGNAINSNPIASPMAAPALPNIIVNANDTARRISGAFAQPIAVKEFNLYSSTGARVSGIFSADVTLVMPYPDLNDDGIVDGTNPPVRASALTLSWLDEKTGIWVRVPGSVVDKKAKTVTTSIHHFSVYGIIGTPSMDLSNAYAFPVPFKPSLGHRQISFKNLSDVGVIRIYTINGELVRELPIVPSSDGLLNWDVTNSRGESVASDVYLYLIQNDQQKKTGKLLIVR